MAVGPIISEFLARNDDNLLDADGDSSAWIELFNPGSEAGEPDGWFRTGNAAVNNKWRRPRAPETDARCWARKSGG